jgi:endonuclease YncB( thermonuclease family)
MAVSRGIDLVAFARYLVVAQIVMVAIAVLAFVHYMEIQPRPRDPAYTHSWQVTSIISGTTFEAVNPEMGAWPIRLYGIAAPRPDQAGGNAARERLAHLIAGKTIIGHIHGNDHDGNLLCDIELEDVDLCHLLVTEGLAIQARDNENPRLRKAEASARKAKRGLWSNGTPNREAYVDSGDKCLEF